MARNYAEMKPDVDENTRRQKIWDRLLGVERKLKLTTEDFLAGAEIFNTGNWAVLRMGLEPEDDSYSAGGVAQPRALRQSEVG